MENNNPSAAPEAKTKSRFSINKAELLKQIFSFRGLIIIVMIISLVNVGYYILFPSRGEFHADSTDTLMWAQATYDSGSILNEEFEYACLLPFGGQWIMVPLIALFGVSMTTQVLGMFIFFLIFIISLFAMLRTMKISLNWSLFTISVVPVMLSCSKKLREIFWGHIIYYSLGMLYAFVGLALIFKVINIIENSKPDPARKKKFIIFSAILLAWCILAGANQLEILTLFLLPAIGALIAERFFYFEKYSSKKELAANIILIGTVIIGTGIGYLWGNVIAGDITAPYASGASNLTSTDDWWEHLSRFFPHLAYLLGMENPSGLALSSAEGINAVLRIMISIVLIVVPIITTILYPKIKSRHIRIFILFHWVMTALVMIGYICGGLSSANWRLSPIVCTSVIMVLILAQWIYTQCSNKKRLCVLTLIPVLVISALTVNDIRKMPADYNQHSGLYIVADYLENNNLTYGYATFWNANSLTVISDSKSKVRSIRVSDEGEYSINYYQSQRSWFDDQPNQENYFLLLNGNEYENIKNNNNLVLQIPHTEVNVEGYTILVFNENIIHAQQWN